MFKFTYFDPKIQSIFSDKKAFCDLAVKQELMPVLEVLKQVGEVEGAVCGAKPGVPGLVYELKGRTFQITYAVDFQTKKIRLYEFQQISHFINWKISLNQNLHKAKEKPIYIPQIGDPQKFIKTVELIHNGTNTAKGLGVAFGSGAKKEKDVARRGDYLGRSVIEIGLARRGSAKNQSSNIYILTERGNRIAQSNDQETRERLLVEALLGFYPIQMILEKTTRDNQELTKELIQEVISLVSLGDAGGATNARRVSSLRALVNWVSRWAGIPIRRKGNDGVQLYIPQIYGDQLRPFGLCAGEFTVPDDFDAPLSENLLSAFEGK
ncbi:MAG: hypothetical protein MH252_21525 [Thermosynechococcaceae cyanobacterium MS004]|nr:hypothetical protein [Thermosynechococcaceae cyanobacterium MS004]